MQKEQNRAWAKLLVPLFSRFKTDVILTVLVLSIICIIFQFSIFWKQEIDRIKLVPGSDTDHNKLRFYKTLKSSFTIEPYLTLVENGNQRSWLSRIRISAHRLHIELGQYTLTQPVTPVSARLCRYCSSDSIDNVKDDCKRRLFYKPLQT